MGGGFRVYWLNVDKQSYVSKLHKNECPHCNPKETNLKGIEVEKYDGGWFSFTSVLDAKQFQETSFPKAMISPCGVL